VSAFKFLAYCGHNNERAKAENKVFKTGSTTGTTYGNILSRKADVGYIHTGVGGVCVPFNSREHVVLDESPGNRFARFGDSGAVIRDGDAEMVGMLWGGIKTEKVHPMHLDHCAVDLSAVTLFTPMEILLEAMQTEVCKALPGVSVQLTLAPTSRGSTA
jgi:hypothetical protein